jgi:hypothetical protein
MVTITYSQYPVFQGVYSTGTLEKSRKNSSSQKMLNSINIAFRMD